jgi:hypothetical protein
MVATMLNNAFSFAIFFPFSGRIFEKIFKNVFKKCKFE